MGITHLICSTAVVCVSLPENEVVVDDRFVRRGQFLISGVWNEKLFGHGILKVQIQQIHLYKKLQYSIELTCHLIMPK